MGINTGCSMGRPECEPGVAAAGVVFWSSTEGENGETKGEMAVVRARRCSRGIRCSDLWRSGVGELLPERPNGL